MGIVTFSILLFSAILSNAEDIRFCSIGMGSFGTSTARLAVQKGFKMVAAFTRHSKHTKTVGQLMGMEDDESLSFEVSGMNKLEQILDETKPHFCIDATNNTLESVFPHFRRLLAKGINILTLSTDAIFPNTRFYWKPRQLYRTLDQVAKENNAVILGGGYSDSLLMPVIPSMTASMITLNGIRCIIKINVDMEGATKKFIRDAGVGLTEEEFNENTSAHIRKIGYWTRAVVESIADGIGYPLLDKTYGRSGESIALFTRTECLKVEYENGLRCEGLDTVVEYGKCAGMNITVLGKAKDDVEILMSVILAVLPNQSEENDLEVVLQGIPELEFAIKNVDSFMASAASLLHRVPMVLNELEPGFYNVNHLKSNVYWDKVSDWNKEREDSGAGDDTISDPEGKSQKLQDAKPDL